MNLREMSKIELHLHIEGAAPPDFIRQLAKEQSIDLSKIFSDDGGYAYRDFWHFLEVYEAACTVLTRPDDFARLTRAVLEEAAQAGVIYTEMFVSPDFCGGRDVVAWRDYVAAIEQAASEAKRDFGIEMRAIATCVRHFGQDAARETARCAQETAGGFVTGFGMGGDEKHGRLGDFSYAFDMAREAGLKLTTHAGEFGGPEEVRDALDYLKVERIGHGVRAIEDLSLVDRLAHEGIVLEVCPGSNVFLGVYDHLRAHPIAKLRKRGVKVTVSTDDPPFFRTDLVQEYENLEREFGWDYLDFRALNLIAIDAAFCDLETKMALTRQVEREI